MFRGRAEEQGGRICVSQNLNVSLKHSGFAVCLRGAAITHSPSLFSSYTQRADAVPSPREQGYQVVPNYSKHHFGAKKSQHMLEKFTRNSDFSLLLDSSGKKKE